jgi:AraC-like DNA-binding protein
MRRQRSAQRARLGNADLDGLAEIARRFISRRGVTLATVSQRLGSPLEIGPFRLAVEFHQPFREIEQPAQRTQDGEILIVAGGSVTRVLETGTVDANPLSVSYRGPGYQKIDHVGPGGLLALRIRVQRRFADYVVRTYFAGRGVPRLYAGVELDNLPARVVEECARQRPSPLFVDGLLRQLIGRAARFEAEGAAGGGPPEWLPRGIALLEKSFRQPLQIGELAQALGVAPAHFSRVFRRFRGQTPQGFLASLRVREGAVLLATTTASIREIALHLGFYDRAHFAREFARSVGQTPQSFRSSSRRD